MLVQTNMGPLPYEAIVAQINARYAEGKTPDLAVKSALQLGIDPSIIATLPGVDENAMRRGMALISSGAFEGMATGTQADIQTAAPVGSAQYNARLAAGLDAFGFPAEEVRRLAAAGLYGPGKQYDPGDMGATTMTPQEAAELRELGSMAGAYAGTQPGVIPVSNLNPIDIAYLAQGRGMFGNELMGYDPTSPISWALQSGIAIPATTYLAQAVGNALGVTDAATVANKAVEQATQGVSTDQIINNLVDLGVNRGTAAVVADAAVSGASPFQIAQDIGGITLTPATQAATTPVTSGVSTTVPVVGSTLPATAGAAGLFAAVPAIAAPVLSGTSTIGMTSPQVQVTGQNVPSTTTAAEVAPSILPTITPQVQVTGQTTPKTQTSGTTEAVTSVLPSLVEQVQVQSKKEAGQKDEFALPVPQVLPPPFEVPIPEVVVTEAGTTKPAVSAADLLKLIGLVGAGKAGAGMLGGPGTGINTIGSVPISNAMIGTTTPQFGDDYYAAVQRYYNAYMPETPRNVAGPLQQWYENKYGA